MIYRWSIRSSCIRQPGSSLVWIWDRHGWPYICRGCRAGVAATTFYRFCSGYCVSAGREKCVGSCMLTSHGCHGVFFWSLSGTKWTWELRIRGTVKSFLISLLSGIICHRFPAADLKHFNSAYYCFYLVSVFLPFIVFQLAPVFCFLNITLRLNKCWR